MMQHLKSLPLEKNFLAIEEKFSNIQNSQIVIYQAPVEKTVSYGEGTVNGPTAILEASHYVEFFDEEFRKQLCFEKGICSLQSRSFHELSIEDSLQLIYSDVKQLLNLGKFVVTLGGEHSISQAPVKAHFEKFNEFSVLQIDAHSDLRDSYQESKFSHASVMARIFEFNKDIVQVGIRAQCIEEYQFIKDNGIKTFYARDLRAGLHGADWISKVIETLNEKVYITFDVDGLDPSVIPATGTPEPGGLFWDETIDLIKRVGSERKIIGIDVVELAPDKDDTSSDFNTAKLIYKLLNSAFQ